MIHVSGRGVAWRQERLARSAGLAQPAQLLPRLGRSSYDRLCAQLCRFVLCYRPVSRERDFTPRSHAGKKIKHFSDLTVHTGLPPPRGPGLTLLVAHVRCVVPRLATEVVSSRLVPSCWLHLLIIPYLYFSSPSGDLCGFPRSIVPYFIVYPQPIYHDLPCKYEGTLLGVLLSPHFTLFFRRPAQWRLAHTLKYLNTSL